VLCPHSIYVFCIYLRTNSDLCHLHHKLIGFYNRVEKCLQGGTDWGFKEGSLHFVRKGLMEHYIGWDGPSPNPQIMHCFKWQLCVWFAVFWFVQNFRNITRHETRTFLYVVYIVSPAPWIRTVSIIRVNRGHCCFILRVFIILPSHQFGAVNKVVL